VPSAPAEEPAASKKEKEDDLPEGFTTGGFDMMPS
jgi:hypothetical protein